MKMKKLMAGLLAGVMAVSLMACSDSSNEAKKEQTDSASTQTATNEAANAEQKLTIKDGVLQVGAEIGYPPMEYLDKDGTTPIGFDIEVANAIGEKLGLDVEIVDTAWDGIFASLDSDRFDCIISSVSITDEREKAYNLTKPYVANRQVLVTKKDSGITSPDDLAGHSVAVQTETTSDLYMKELQANGLVLSEYFVYDKVIQCFDDLSLDRTDAVFVDSVVAAYYMGEEAQKYDIVWESEESEPMGICIKKGNDALTEAIEKAVDELYADGTMKTIAEKYFGYDVTQGLR